MLFTGHSLRATRQGLLVDNDNHYHLEVCCFRSKYDEVNCKDCLADSMIARQLVLDQEPKKAGGYHCPEL